MSLYLKPDSTIAPKLRRSCISSVAIRVVFAGICMVAGTIPTLAEEDDAPLLDQARHMFKALPRDAATAEFPITPARVDLGRKLFSDPRLSVDGTVSCSRCHLAALCATDGLPGAKGALEKVNDRRST